ncbi:MAG: trigger factor [Lachnospiraceae bacterium]
MADLNKENTTTTPEEETVEETAEEKEVTTEPAQETSDSEDKTEKENAAEQEETGKSNNKTILIVEIIIALLAIGFIIFALVSNNKKNNSVSDNTSASGDLITDTTGTETASIDNSVLYENMPALPDITEFNIMDEAAAEAAVADGTMIKFTTADDVNVYVGNFNDSATFAEAVTPSEEELDEAIFQNIISYYGEVSEADHTIVENGDVISANYVGKLDGVAFEGGTAENVSITLGAGGYIPGFEEGFIGMEIGETKDVPITFPEDYGNTDLAGKDVIFTFTINDITGTMTYPELTDELVQGVFYDGSVTTVAECEEYFRSMLLQDNIWDYLLENYYVSSISEDAVSTYYNDMMEYYDQMSLQYQMPVSDILAYSGATVDDLKQETIMNAGYTAVQFTICQAIATENNITVSDEDIANLAAEYGYTDAESFLSDNGEQTVREYLIQENVLKYLSSLVEE